MDAVSRLALFGVAPARRSIRKTGVYFLSDTADVGDDADHLAVLRAARQFAQSIVEGRGVEAIETLVEEERVELAAAARCNFNEGLRARSCLMAAETS